MCAQQVVEILPEVLSSTQLSNLKIAQQAVKSLPHGMHRIRMLGAASQLPSAASTGAYAESYHYDAGTGKLFLRAERLNKVGEMLTVMAHANAHIQCGSASSDQVSLQCDSKLHGTRIRDSNVSSTTPCRHCSVQSFLAQ